MANADRVADAERERQIRNIAARPYPIRLSGDPEDGYVVEVPDLPGCMTASMDYVEALSNVREAIEAWVEDALEAGEEIPSPSASTAPRAMTISLDVATYEYLYDKARTLRVSPEDAAALLLRDVLLPAHLKRVGAALLDTRPDSGARLLEGLIKRGTHDRAEREPTDLDDVVAMARARGIDLRVGE